MNEELREKVNIFLKETNKKHGQGAVMSMSDNATYDGQVIHTGSINLDYALGIGGYPQGRIIEIYGPESSGKSTLALNAVMTIQKSGGIVGYIDAENALDTAYAKDIGVNVDDLVFSQPNSGEEALDICEDMVKSGLFDCIVVDSVAALTPQAELDGEMGDSHIGLLARLMSQAMRKLVGICNKTKCSIIFINQIREKVGVMFGNPETTTGGRALKFYSSVRLELRRGEVIKDGADIVGHVVKVKVVKNKMSPPFKECSFDLIYGKGISRSGEIVDLGVDLGLIKKSGAWYSYNDEKIGQGRENAKLYIEEHPKIENEITQIIYNTIGIPVPNEA